MVAVALVALTVSMIVTADAGAGFRAPGLGRALDRIVEAPGGPPGVSVLIQRGKRKRLSQPRLRRGPHAPAADAR